MTQTPFPDGLGFEIPPHERTPLVEQLLRIIAELREENRRLREELDRLRGLPPQPARKPSMLGSDRPPSAPTAPKRKLLDGKRPGSAKCHKTRKLEIHETIPLPPANLPPGAKKISHRDFIVQDIEIKNRNIRYRREVYLLPDGSVRTGELPAHVQGHFGTTLRAHILYQYYQNHITQPLIREELLDYGVVISVGQIDRILHHGHDKFHAEKESLLPAARELATHFHTDDTSARHRGQNYHTTGIGNESFAVFTTTPTKSRINFLELLCAPYQEYVVDGDTMEYLTYYDLPQRWLKRLRESIEDGERRIVIEGSQPWEQQLQSWGIIASSRAS